MTFRPSRFPPAILAWLLVAPFAAADWPQFRGPRGDGISTASGLPEAWGPSQHLRWQAVVPGRGRSSPVIVGEQVWMTAADEIPAAPEVALLRLAAHPDPGQVYLCRRVLLKAVCLDRHTGTLRREIDLKELHNPAPIHRLNSFATPTPVAETGRLWCDFGDWGTFCLDTADGRVLWRARLPAEHVLGPGSSPVLWKDRLILVRDGADEQYVAALDKHTGNVAWKMPRPPMEVETRYERKAYSTPLVIDPAGDCPQGPPPHAPPQAVVPGAQWVVSYDPATGRELWRIRHGKGFSLAPRPIFGRGLVYLCTGCYHPELWAIRLPQDPGPQGELNETHVAWKAKGPIPMMSSPILVGDALYCVSDNGIVSCFDADAGAIRWRARIGGEHCASPLFADGRLYFFDRDGTTSVLKPGSAFVRLAENRLEGPLLATPAAVADALYLRTDSQLYCVGMTKDERQMSKE